MYFKNTMLITLSVVVNHEEELTIHQSLSALVQNTKFLIDGTYLVSVSAICIALSPTARHFKLGISSTLEGK